MFRGLDVRFDALGCEGPPLHRQVHGWTTSLLRSLITRPRYLWVPRGQCTVLSLHHPRCIRRADGSIPPLWAHDASSLFPSEHPGNATVVNDYNVGFAIGLGVSSTLVSGLKRARCWLHTFQNSHFGVDSDFEVGVWVLR